MRFARHVFAYILKQPICWLDLSFYDPQLFNNLRMLICSDFKESGYEGDFTIMEKSANGVSGFWLFRYLTLLFFSQMSLCS